MTSTAAVAFLGDFALSCDSLGTLFRRAVAVIAEHVGTDDVAIGESRDADFSVPIHAGDVDPWGYVTVRATDVDADFLRAVAAILGQAIVRERAEESLEVRIRQQSAIAELSRLAVNPIDGRTLTRACDLIIERVGVEHSLFWELDVASQELRFRAGNRWFPDSLLTLPLTATSQGAECVARNEPVIVDDYASDTRFASARSLLDGGVCSGVVVPVASGNGCAGILTAHTRAPRTFTDDDIMFIEALANILAEALERDGARQELAASEDRYREVVDSATDIIFTMTADGRLLTLNPAFERITGYRVSDWIGRSVHELNPDAEALIDPVLIRGASSGPFVAETVVETPRGTVALELSMTARTHDGVVVAIHGFARDVTEARHAEHERRTLQVKLEQANRIAGLGKLAATVAHEFNNVLMGISPFVDVMRRGKSVETALEHISRAVARGRRITQDILRFTQPAEPARADLLLDGWLRMVIEEAQPILAAGHTIDLVTCGEPLNVRADAGQLQQVFTNLILNARDAMPGGGRVTIELRHEDASAKLPFALTDADQFAHIILRDNGCGMNDEMLRHAFEPLFTTKRNGTGLGLPVVLQVVQKHGGELFVESTLGVGTTFHIFLPLAVPEVIMGPRDMARVPSVSSGKLVVLVEDDPIVATGLVGILALEGMAVRLVKTGAEAISILRRVVPDLVILDVGLPDIDGTQVFTTLGPALDNVPVIFSTGHADRTKIEDLLARPNVGFLLKPYEHAELLRTMAKVAGRSKRIAAA
ncbi:MAG TPA: ATP-binding protein [Thermoanaerobaculia bacterium]|jgi:PAS domain S-box-containing protein